MAHPYATAGGEFCDEHYTVPGFRVLAVGWRGRSWKQMIAMGCSVCCARGELEGMGIQKRSIYPDCQGGLPRGGDVCTEAQRMSRS